MLAKQNLKADVITNCPAVIITIRRTKYNPIYRMRRPFAQDILTSSFSKDVITTLIIKGYHNVLIFLSIS